MQALPTPLRWPPIFPLQKGLVLWLPFNERSGGFAFDRSGKGNKATLTGCTWNAGRRGRSISLNGSSDYLEVADDDSLDLATFSFMAWLKPSENDVRAPVIMKRAGGSGYANYTMEYRGDQTDLISCAFQDSDGNWRGFPSVSAVEKDVWTHVAGVKTLTRGNVYLNGVLDKYTARTETPATSTHPIRIGWFGTYYFPGLVSSVRVYNRSRNAAEIKRIYESEHMLARH